VHTSVVVRSGATVVSLLDHYTYLVATCIVYPSLLLPLHPVPYCLGANHKGQTGRRRQRFKRTAAPTGAGPDAGGAKEQDRRSAYQSGHSAEHAAVGQTSYDHCVAELTALIWSKLPQTAGRRLKVSVKRSGILKTRQMRQSEHKFVTHTVGFIKSASYKSLKAHFLTKF
jgi:hypothetical protein